jgi:Uma2 family endonuclease
VAESSLSIDRGRKLRIYAERGVPEYWIVDVVARRIEVHRDPLPGAGKFRQSCIKERRESIELVAFPDVSLHVEDILR